VLRVHRDGDPNDGDTNCIDITGRGVRRVGGRQCRCTVRANVSRVRRAARRGPLDTAASLRPWPFGRDGRTSWSSERANRTSVRAGGHPLITPECGMRCWIFAHRICYHRFLNDAAIAPVRRVRFYRHHQPASDADYVRTRCGRGDRERRCGGPYEALVGIDLHHARSSTRSLFALWTHGAASPI
jgi:hypothetical protein